VVRLYEYFVFVGVVGDGDECCVLFGVDCFGCSDFGGGGRFGVVLGEQCGVGVDV